MNHNKVCNVRDFAELAPVITDAYGRPPDGCEYRKEWEVAMSLRGLDAYGAIRPDARLLGVGAGTERTSFVLSRQVAQVFCTDLYLEGGWPGWAEKGMLNDPTPWSGGPYDRQRLVVQHMDGCVLHYPDAFFDGIYSASSIEHFGTLDDVARSAAEMGRVLKPGGVIALTTEWRIGGTEGDGWGNVIVFNADTLRRYVIEPSGCVPVDALDPAVDDATRATAQDLDWVLATQKNGHAVPTPHVVLTYGGYVFTSVSVVMVKPR